MKNGVTNETISVFAQFFIKPFIHGGVLAGLISTIFTPLFAIAGTIAGMWSDFKFRHVRQSAHK